MCNDEPRYHLERGVPQRIFNRVTGRDTGGVSESFYNVLKHSSKFDGEHDPKECPCEHCLVLLDTGLTKDLFRIKKFKNQVKVKLNLKASPAWESSVYRFKIGENPYDKRVIELAELLEEMPKTERWFGGAGKSGLAMSPVADAYLASYLNFSYMMDSVRKSLKHP